MSHIICAFIGLFIGIAIGLTMNRRERDAEIKLRKKWEEMAKDCMKGKLEEHLSQSDS